MGLKEKFVMFLLARLQSLVSFGLYLYSRRVIGFVFDLIRYIIYISVLYYNFLLISLYLVCPLPFFIVHFRRQDPRLVRAALYRDARREWGRCRAGSRDRGVFGFKHELR
jgi:hypothetical protein